MLEAFDTNLTLIDTPIHAHCHYTRAIRLFHISYIPIEHQSIPQEYTYLGMTSGTCRHTRAMGDCSPN